MAETNATNEKNVQKLPVLRPATDILEREDGYHIYMDLPGVRKDELEIDMQEGEVTVSATSHAPLNPDHRQVEMEFGSARLSRTFTLSDAVDRAGIKATLTDGVLELFLPKVAEETPKRINIQQG